MELNHKKINIVTIVLLVCSVIMLSIGFAKAYEFNYSKRAKMKMVGGVIDNSFIDFKSTLKSFSISSGEFIEGADIYIIYTVDYTECANAVIEIKEYSKLMKNYFVNENLKIQQFLLFVDESRKRAIKELKFFKLDFPTGIGHDDKYVNDLQKFNHGEKETKQILFIDSDYKVVYRNKISSVRIVPTNEKRRVIEFGAESFNK